MKKIQSHVEILIERLQVIEAKMDQFIDLSEMGHTDLVEKERMRRDAQASQIYFVPPDHFWKEGNTNQIKMQTELKQLYWEWKDQFDLLLKNAPKTVLREIEESHRCILNWIERDRDWEIRETLEENKKLFKDETDVFRQIIKSLSETRDNELILIPDTNALIICPDLQEYSNLVNEPIFTVVFIPTVLQELDNLKQTHSNPDFRKKVFDNNQN